MKQIVFFFFLVASSSLFAQKFGYINTQELLTNMTEIKLAESQLQLLQKELQTKGEQMVIQFESDYKAYSADAEKGTLSKIQMQQKEETLTAKRDEIQKYENKIQEELLIKKEALFKPILDRVKGEIEKLGKDGGYTMIFDSSIGMILHAAEVENLMPSIKTKLGIN